MPKAYPVLFVIGGITGIVLFMAISLSMGWVVTSGRAHETAEETSEQAVINSLVPICVYQFRAEADSATELQTLRKMDKWKRGDFVKEHGWSTMPGSDSPAEGLGSECAQSILKKSS